MNIAALLRNFFKLLFFLCSLQVLGQQGLLTPINPPEAWGPVVGMDQDDRGFVWFASHNGLHRYDGYRYTSYFHEPDNKNSLSSSRLETVHVSNSGIIWIGTFLNGLDRFDPITRTFTHFMHEPDNPASLSDNTITTILEDRQGILWVGTHGGLHRFHPQSGTFTRYQYSPEDTTSLSNDQVRALYQDRQGTLWVGTGSPWESELGEGGLNKFNRVTGTFTRYLHDPKDSSTLVDNKVRAIFEDSQGMFWVGTLGDGLHTMDRENGTFTRHRHDPDHPEKLSRSPVLGGDPDGVTFVHEDVTGAIWIGTNGGGVSRYDRKTDKVEHFVSDTKNSGGLQNNNVWQALTTHEGVLWFSTLFGYVYRTDPLRVSFDYKETGAAVYGFFEEASGKLWVGTSGGLKVYDLSRKDNSETKLENSIPSLTKGEVISFIEDRKGNLWIGGNKGLWKFHANAQTFKLYEHDPEGPGSLGKGVIISLYEDREGNLWVGTEQGGLCLFDPTTETFRRFRYDRNDLQSLSNNTVTAIHEDSQGNLWVGTWNGGGVNKLNRRTGTFKRYLEKSTHHITSIREDASGTLWVGSHNLGLFLLDVEKDDFVKHLDKSTGKIISAGVRGMAKDEEGNLWISSLGGLYRLDQEGNLAATYGAETGLNPEAFNLLATYTGNSGNLYLGDTTGFYIYSPQNKKVNLHPPIITLTDLRLFDELVMPKEEGGLLELPLNQTKKINLSYDQNVFSFDFTGIHYSNPSQNRILYMLENYDEDWRHVNSEHTATYFKVVPGEYVFRVKAASSEGVWDEKAIAVIINPPWWQTWWAYSIYTLLLAGFLFTVDKNRRRKIIHRERERTRKRELAQAREIEKAYHELKRTQVQLIQAEKMASLGELTAGIAHEIQNPLNFVNNFSEVSQELCQEIYAEVNALDISYEEKQNMLALLSDLLQNQKKILLHGQRAETIVKNMLQHSRGSTGEKQLYNLNTLTEEYLRLAYYGIRTKDKSFGCILETSYNEKLEKVEIVPQELGRVLLNLFNNAFYAVQQKQEQSPEGYEPKVRVSTASNNGKIEIKVWDNGIGIPSGVKNKIFQPFFTTKPTGKGTGLGLSLSYDIVTKGHGGQLKVESVEGEYTEFIVLLPEISVVKDEPVLL